jgi:hypothetical protein
MKHTIEVEWGQIESIIVKELTRDLHYTLEDLENVKQTGKGYVYSMDKDEDIEELTIRAGALAVVIGFYGGKNEFTG